MTANDAPELIEKFVRCVGKYLAWDNITRVSLATRHATEPRSIAEVADQKDLNDSHNHKMDAVVKLRSEGPKLGALLESFSFSSQTIFKVLHCIGGGGGGAESLSRFWLEAKSELLAIAVKLRNNATGDQYLSPAECISSLPFKALNERQKYDKLGRIRNRCKWMRTDPRGNAIFVNSDDWEKVVILLKSITLSKGRANVGDAIKTLPIDDPPPEEIARLTAMMRVKKQRMGAARK